MAAAVTDGYEHVCPQALADQLTDIVTDAVLTINRPGEALDLHMVSFNLCKLPDLMCLAA